MTATVKYKGDLRCESVHLQSGSVFETDAPTDNRGKGERFSPTDTVCVALAACMITTMGIRAIDMKIDLKGTMIDVTKHMLNDPRRIGKIQVHLKIPDRNVSDHDKEILQKIGDTCPVIRSLHPDLQLEVTYEWIVNG